MKSKLFLVISFISPFLFSCDNEEINNEKVDAVLTETLNVVASTDGQNPTELSNFKFGVELIENQELVKYQGKIENYTIEKVTFQITNYLGPTEPSLQGSLSFGELATNIASTSISEINAFTLTSENSAEIEVSLISADKLKLEELLLSQSGVSVFLSQVFNTNSEAVDVSFDITVKIYAKLSINDN